MEAANRMRVAWEAVLLLRSGCDAGELVSERRARGPEKERAS